MSFRDIKGQDNAVSFLKKALESGRVAHAYIFLGPSGVGKTWFGLTFREAGRLAVIDTEGGTALSAKYAPLGASAVLAKVITGMTTTNYGGTTNVAHGLTFSKIVSWSASAVDDSGNLVSLMPFANYSWLTPTSIVVKASDTTITNVQFRAVIWYQP